MNPILDLTVNSLLLQIQDLSVNDRKNMVKFLAEKMLGVEVLIEASSVKSLSNVFAGKLTIKETKKLENKINSENRTDTELECVIVRLIELNGAQSVKKLSENSGIYTARIARIVKDLGERAVLRHNGVKRNGSAWHLI